MELYPAIDLRGGQCVRLYQGDYARETCYDADPVAVALRYQAAGARWIHAVDLDAARTGVPVNRPTIGAIAESLHPSVSIQVGGGVRDQAAAEALFDAGAARVVVGTAALENPEFLCELAAKHPVTLALDVRGEEVAVRGWAEGSGRRILDVLVGLRCDEPGASVDGAGGARIEAVAVTDIGRDGTLSGPDLPGLSRVLAATGVAVIASGGVSSLDDLVALAALDVGGRRLAGVIVGRALYEGRFGLEEAMAACATSV
ncbi:MAG: 1-(5-phosphoribosyl)-5-[(5-phosphoribosylamino)methylideneamino]imidazole-4-carboxamide isomerase [Acidimicrobiales bacterium]